MALNAVTIAAIVAACWAHPQGQAYLAKIDQIEALSIACGNPCCKTVAAQPEYHGGRWRDVTYEEVSERWELLGLRLQPSSRLSTRQEDTHAPGILAKDEITGTPDISMPLVLRGVTAHMPKVDATLAGLLEKRDAEQHAAMLQRRRDEEYLLLLMLAEID